MSFHYVDRIFSIEPGKSATGIKNVTRNESLYYWLPDGKRVLSPAVVTEALAQLGAWLKMFTTDFTKRPVLLADELTTYHGFVQVGDQIDLNVKILDFDDDVVVSTSQASVNGKLILEAKCCRGFMLPMEDFDDRENVIRQYKSLWCPEFKDVSRVGSGGHRLSANAGAGTWESLKFIDGLIEHKPYEKVVGFKNFSACEPYFATHFPYKPVVPGVLLMTFMGEVCQYLIKEDPNAPVRAKALIPTFIQNVRFRKFVRPGDQCILSATLKQGDCREDGSDVLVKAEMMANDQRVMQAEMGFRVMVGAKSKAFEREPFTSLEKVG